MNVAALPSSTVWFVGNVLRKGATATNEKLKCVYRFKGKAY